MHTHAACDSLRENAWVGREGHDKSVPSGSARQKERGGDRIAMHGGDEEEDADGEEEDEE